MNALKRVDRHAGLNELRKAIEDYIHYYNNERISLKLKDLSPVEYRTQTLKAA
jgi:putative transposase